MRALGVVGIFVVACSHDSGGLSPADYAAQAAAALCDYEVRCGLFVDQPSCIAYGQVHAQDFQPLLDSGKVSFDGNAAQACLDATSTMSCDTTQMSARSLPAVCQQILVGSVAMNGACEINEECQSGACSVPDCGSACCAGTCAAAQAPAGSGDPCVTRACDTGLACSIATETCQPLAGSGGACNFTEDCAYGLGCAGGVCKPLPAIGDPCPQGVCADIGALCNAQQTCVMIGLTGASCATDEECSPYYQCSGVTCAALPTSGEPCSMRGCSDGSFCAIADGSATGTCTPPGGSGASCTTAAQCASYYCGSDATCDTVPVCD